MLLVALGAIWHTQSFRPVARAAPLLAAIPMAAVMVVVVTKEAIRIKNARAVAPGPISEPQQTTEGYAPPDRPILGNYFQAFISLAAATTLFYTFGSVVTALLFPPLHLLIVGAWSLRSAIATSLVSGGLVWLLLERLLSVRLYSGLF